MRCNEGACLLPGDGGAGLPAWFPAVIWRVCWQAIREGCTAAGLQGKHIIVRIASIEPQTAATGPDFLKCEPVPGFLVLVGAETASLRVFPHSFRLSSRKEARCRPLRSTAPLGQQQHEQLGGFPASRAGYLCLGVRAGGALCRSAAPALPLMVGLLPASRSAVWALHLVWCSSLPDVLALCAQQKAWHSGLPFAGVPIIRCVPCILIVGSPLQRAWH